MTHMIFLLKQLLSFTKQSDVKNFKISSLLCFANPTNSGRNLTRVLLMFLVAGCSFNNLVIAKNEIIIKSNSQPAADICAGTNSVIIHSFSLKGSGKGGNVTAISFSNTGTYTSGDISSFRLYSTAAATFVTPSFLSTINNPSNAAIQEFGAFSAIKLKNNDEIYFWIVMDVASAAVNNHYITVSKTLPGNITADNDVVEGTPNNGSGQQTMLRSTGGVASAVSSSVCYGYNATINLIGYGGSVQWQQSTDGVTGWLNVIGGSGVTQATYTTPALTSSTFYRAIVSSGSCTSAYSTNASVEISTTGTWLGSTTDWNTDSNWCGGVPTAETNVTILPGGNQPVITASATCHNITINNGTTLTLNNGIGLTVSGNWTNNGGTFTAGTHTVLFNGTEQTIGGSSSTTFYNLTIDGSDVSLTTTAASGLTTVSNSLVINSGKKLTINPGKALTVNGTFTNNSSSGLVIKSDASGTGSFIDNGQIEGPGTARIERFLTPYTTQNASDNRFHFLSSPVGTNQTIMPEFQNMTNNTDDFYMWSETANQWINTKQGANFPYTWNTAFGTGNGAFVTGKGYLIAYPSPAKTKNFTGKPFTGNISINCTSTGGGWNLLGNPFPSAIDWELVSKGDGIDEALYYYENDSPRYKYYVPLTGGIGSSTDGGSRYIPAMQGFMVHARTSGTKTVTFKNSDRLHENLNLYYKSSLLTENVLNLSVEGNGSRDDSRVCFYDQATENFDGACDAYKLFSYNSLIPELYTLTTDGSQLAINTLPIAQKYVNVPVAFIPGTAGTFLFSAEGVSSFPSSTYILLEDLITGTTQNLNDNPVYTFTSDAGDVTNRFILHFKDATSVPDSPTKETFSVFFTDGNINITTQQALNAEIMVTNMPGQVVLRGQTNGNTLTSINAISLQNGLYILSLVEKNKVLSQKIIISR